MNTIIEYFKELFNKPTDMWTSADMVLFTVSLMAVLCVVFVLVYTAYLVADYIKKKKKDKKGKKK